MEIILVIIGFFIFVLIWNSRKYFDNLYVLIIGTCGNEVQSVF
jgi:hypothetical protein